MAVRVKGWKGVAFNIVTPAFRSYIDENGEPAYEDDPNRVRVMMVGDDKVHVVDKDDCTEIADEEYCHECGQIGCTHDGRER